MPPTFETAFGEATTTHSSAKGNARTASDTIRSRSRALRNARASQTMNAVPTKFLAQQQVFRRHLEAVSYSALQVPRFATITTPGDALTYIDTHPTAMPAAPETPAPSESLPELPVWLMHLFAGVASFVLVVAVVLFLAQFPPNVTWIGNLKRKLQGYAELQQEDHASRDRTHGRSSAVAPGYDSFEQRGEVERVGALEQRKPRHLRVNTRTGQRGLGLAVLGIQDARLEIDERGSHDEEALPQRPKSPTVVKWKSLAAALPSITMFSDGQRTPHNVQSATVYELQSDVESGCRSSRTFSAASQDILDNTSPLHRILGGEGEAPRSALLQKVNDGIHSAADRLSRAFHDQVNGPEEGLLLPVHNSEREAFLMPGVFVD